MTEERENQAGEKKVELTASELEKMKQDLKYEVMQELRDQAVNVENGNETEHREEPGNRKS